MKHFKLPLIVTGIVLPLMIVVGIASIIWIHNLDISNRKKEQRAALMGKGVATMGCIVIAPFWLFASAKLGKERRAKKALQ